MNAHVPQGHLAPRTGDIWKEVDPRFSRHIMVLGVDDSGKVRLKTCYRAPETVGWAAFGPVRKAKPERFNGKRGGYSLVIRSTT